MPKQKYTSAFKVRTVIEGLRAPDGVAAYCRRVGISDVLFYQWQKQLLTNADAVFEKVPKSAEKKINRLEEELKRKDQIIAVVTEKALELKKKTYQIKCYRHLSIEVKLELYEMLQRYTNYDWSKAGIYRKWEISLHHYI